MKPYPPLGLLYISSYLKSRGFQVQVFDSTFSSREHFRRFVQENHPPVVGLYCNMMTRSSVLDLIAVCKQT
ncbi:MAG TPA: B12-binding domain-containing radical SAM protein, partial [Acidobacteriota bacterium]|nr:B12-binding domain-containing radical SAM protein [Acidobacteriota bacterium]